MGHATIGTHKSHGHLEVHVCCHRVRCRSRGVGLSYDRQEVPCVHRQVLQSMVLLPRVLSPNDHLMTTTKGVPVGASVVLPGEQDGEVQQAAVNGGARSGVSARMVVGGMTQGGKVCDGSCRNCCCYCSCCLNCNCCSCCCCHSDCCSEVDCC